MSSQTSEAHLPYEERTVPFNLGNATNTLVIPLGDGTGLVQFQRSSARSATKRGHFDYATVTMSQLSEKFPQSGVLVAMDAPSISLFSQRQATPANAFKDLAESAGIKLGGRTGVGKLVEAELEKFVQVPFNTQHNLLFHASWAGSKGPVTHLVAKIFLGIPKTSNTKVVYEDFFTNNLTKENIYAGTLAEMNTFGRRSTERLATLRKSNPIRPIRVVQTDKSLLQENANLKADNETMLHELKEMRKFRLRTEEILGSISENQ